MVKVREPDVQTPEYLIKANGNDITTVLQGRLVSLRLTDNPGFEADTLEINLDDSDGKLDIPPRGAELSLALGWKTQQLIDKGTFTVTEVEYEGPPDTLILRAHATDMRSTLNLRREESYHNLTLGQLVLRLAGRNRLGSAISQMFDDIELAHEDQAGETDAAFLTRLANAFDAIATVKSGYLMFIARGLSQTATGQDIELQTIKRNAGDSYRFALADQDNYVAVTANYVDKGSGKKGTVTVGDGANDTPDFDDSVPVGANGIKTLDYTYATQARARQSAQTEWASIKKNKAEREIYKGVMAYWWTNRKKKQKSSVTVTDLVSKKSSVKTETSAVNLKVIMSAHASAATALAAAKKEWEKISQRSPDNKTFTGVQAFWKDSTSVLRKVVYTAKMAANENKQTEPSADNVKVLRHVYASDANAKRAALAELARLKRGRATFSMTLAHARPELYPETPIKLEGFKPFICANDWMLARAVHNLSNSGYTMDLELELLPPKESD